MIIRLLLSKAPLMLRRPGFASAGGKLGELMEQLDRKINE
jgi:hypothetical protein